MSNNYIGKNSLTRFLEKLYETFSKKGHAHSKADILDFPNIDAIVHEAIYGIVDGSIENISNNRAKYVRDYAFYQHQNLITANFPIATSIGDYSFYKCPVLTSVNTPSATNIGTFAFKGCSSLTSANYPLATTVGQGAFDECASLSSVNLPVVEVIEPLTFRRCENLTTVDLSAVTNIGTQAFYNSGITSLTLRSNAVCVLDNEDAFYFTPIEDGTGYIYVPSGLVNSYKVADGWSTYANQIRAIA